MRRTTALSPLERALTLALILPVLGVVPACASVADYTVSESERGTFPTPEETREIYETHISPDARHIATLENRPANIDNLPEGVIASRGWYVRRDGEEQTTWSQIRRGSIVWSADSRHVLYVVKDETAVHVVVDDEAGPPFDDIPRASFVGPGGDFMYSAKRGDSSFVIRNGELYPGCADAAWWWVDSSGQRVGCITPKDGRWQLAVDGVPSVEWDHVPYFGFTEPTGKHYFYIALDGDKQRIVFDTTPGPPYDDIGKVLCQDDGSCVFWVVVDGKWHMKRGETMSPGYDVRQIWNRELLVSPDGQHVAYITGEDVGGRVAWTLHMDDQDYGPCDGYGALIWGGDGARWGVIARRGQRRIAMVDGEESPSAAAVAGDVPFFSDDGSRSAYFLQGSNGMTLMVDGKEAITMDKIVGPDMSFSPDGKHWAVAGRQGDTWHLVLDGKVMEEGYGDVRAPGPVISEDGTISFIARKENRIVCVTYSPRGKR